LCWFHGLGRVYSLGWGVLVAKICFSLVSRILGVAEY
jgi:hypothetical protein